MESALSKHFAFVSAPNTNKCLENNIQKDNYSDLYRNLRILYKAMRSNASPLISSVHLIEHPCPRQAIAALRHQLKKEFGFKDSVLREARIILNYFRKRIFNLSNDTQIISVHVRRRDYLNYVSDRLLELAPVSYYENAFKYFRLRFKSVGFLIFSDDMNWSKKNLLHPNVYFAGNGKVTSPILDFACMSLCDHHIISDGTFGFTSAIFGNGLVAYYSQPLVKLFARYGVIFVCPFSREFIPISSSKIV